MKPMSVTESLKSRLKKISKMAGKICKETSEREENAQSYGRFYLLNRVISHYLLCGAVSNRAGGRFGAHNLVIDRSAGGVNA